MARTKVRFARLTLPRRYNPMARDWLFGKLDAVHDEHPATRAMQRDAAIAQLRVMVPLRKSTVNVCPRR